VALFCSALWPDFAPPFTRLVVIVHQLGGRLRNCGCSTGSLGGIDHVAALPATLRQLGAADARYVLTGIVDGDHAGLGKALATRGWERNPADLVVSSDPLSEVAKPGILAVMDTSQGSPIAHQRVVRPLLDGGATATVLVLDAANRIRSQQVVPIDQSLPVDAGVLAGFLEPRTVTVIHTDQAQLCASCHPAATQAWSASRHALAWNSLTPANQVDACITCHTSPGTAAVGPRVQHVSCIACHM
jgi:cytochrome c553